jgi:hypothetical protein
VDGAADLEVFGGHVHLDVSINNLLMGWMDGYLAAAQSDENNSSSNGRETKRRPPWFGYLSMI